MLLMALSVPAATVTPGVAVAQVDKTGTMRVLVKRATEAAKAGDYKGAAELWQRIYLMDVRRPMSLYNAAVMEEKAGLLDDAARHLREFLTAATEKHKRYTLAKVRLGAVVAKMQAAEAREVAERAVRERRERDERDRQAAEDRKQSVVVKDAPAVEGTSESPPIGAGSRAPDTKSNTAAWVAIVAGGVAVLAGGGLYLNGAAEYDDLKGQVDSGAKTAAEVQGRVDELQRNDYVYFGAMGLGAVAVGIGAWLVE